MTEQPEVDRSLNEMEPWGPVPEDATPLVERVHNVRHKPISSLTADDLRLLIGQKISLDILLPLAIQTLTADPFIEATYYPGDLLETVLEAPESTWAARPENADTVLAILNSIHDFPDDLANEIAEELAKDIAQFRKFR